VGVQFPKYDLKGVCMSVQSPLTTDLLALGVRPGDVLLVHSSLRSLGRDESQAKHAAEAVVESLLSALGPTGTLLMPALSYEAVNPANPVFDVRNTPVCVGALPEYFRTRPGTLRSVHPTHSVCGVGRRAEDLLKDHIRDTTPCGPNSPFSKIPHIGGHILFLGCGLRPNTTMHAVEEHVVPPYLFGEPVEYRIIQSDGAETAMTVVSHNFKGWAQRYDRLEQYMHHGLKKGPVLQAECYLLDAAEMWFAALTQLRLDPLSFVERIEP
jgi:aminoglycoside 3-N-acetyltransferase